MSEEVSNDAVAALEEEKQKLINKNTELLSDLKDLKEFRNSINELGGVDKFKTLMEQQSAAQNEKLAQTTNVDDIKRQYSEQMEALKGEIGALKNGIVATKLESSLKSAVTKAGGEYDLLQHALKSRVQADLIDSQNVSIKVLDENGNDLIVEGRDANLNDLVGLFKTHTTFGKAFAQKEFSGSGAKNGLGVKVSNNPFIKGSDNYSLEAQTKLFKENPAQAKALMAEAGIAVSQ